MYNTFKPVPFQSRQGWAYGVRLLLLFLMDHPTPRSWRINSTAASLSRHRSLILQNLLSFSPWITGAVLLMGNIPVPSHPAGGAQAHWFAASLLGGVPNSAAFPVLSLGDGPHLISAGKWSDTLVLWLKARHLMEFAPGVGSSAISRQVRVFRLLVMGFSRPGPAGSRRPCRFSHERLPG